LADDRTGSALGHQFPRFNSFNMSMSRAWSATILFGRSVLFAELFKLLGVVGLHAAVLVAPAVPGRLGDLEVAGHLEIVLPSPKSFSPSASSRMICSGVWRRCFMLCCPPFSPCWGTDSHSRWITSRGPGQVHHDEVVSPKATAID
jgi:hypothetical protein